MTARRDDTLILQASAVAIDGRALVIEGAPGSGKSSLALALIDRGAQLIGDDGVTITRMARQAGAVLVASPPPRIAGLLEVRGVGLARVPVAPPAPLALILTLDDHAERLPDGVARRDILGCAIPVLPFIPGSIAPAQRAMMALSMHGLGPE